LLRCVVGAQAFGGMMKAIVKLTFLIAVMATASLNAWAQVADRFADEAAPAAPTEKPAAKEPPPLFIVNDNIIGYYYLPTATNPGAGQTPKNVVVFNHFDVWTYGTNFFNAEYLKATNGRAPPFGTPAAPCDQNGPLDPPGSERCPGYTEIYGFLRSTLGWNQLSGTKMFAAGPLTNIEFAFGVDANTDNTTLGSAKRSIQAGLQFDFDSPYKGFLNVAAYAYKEWQHDGFASMEAVFGIDALNPGGKVNYDTTWAIEMLYVQPLSFQPLPLTFKSFAVIHGPKGCGEPCNPGPGLKRTTEYLTQQTLALDVGKLAWGKADQFSVWTAYRWWKNKFGIDPNQPGFSFPFTVESTWLTGATLTF